MRSFAWSLMIVGAAGAASAQPLLFDDAGGVDVPKPAAAPVIQPRIDPATDAAGDAEEATADEAAVDPAPTFEAPATEVAPEEAGWAIEIVPNGGCAGEDCSAMLEYRRAYDAIPFSRAEWLANPSYRHDSAMALMTGQPINGRTHPTRQLEIYQDPRPYRRTFFPRLAPADLHYNYSYGRYQYRPFGWGWYGSR